jgi:hypothetical protein
MARSLFGNNWYRLLHAAGGEGEDGGGPTPAEVNAEGNQRRLDRIAAIGRTADAQRAHQMRDANGEEDGGEFAGGEFADDPQAQAAARARQTELEEQEARDAEEEAEQAEARRLQAEGAGMDPEGEGTSRTPPEDDPAADEKVVGGVRYYKNIIGGQERWMTLAQMREAAQISANAEETLRRAQDALRSAAQAEVTPKGPPAEDLSEQDLENIVISAATGDEEAVKKLVSVIRHRPQGPSPQDISRQVTQQIATQREVDRSEKANEDVLGNEKLAPEFRRRLSELGKQNPKMRIYDAKGFRPDALSPSRWPPPSPRLEGRAQAHDREPPAGRWPPAPA